MSRHCFVISIILLFSTVLFADIYYWVDKDGIKHFSNVSMPLSNIKVTKEEEKLTLAPSCKISKKSIYKVIKVYDGDSIKVKGHKLIFIVRLVGIDAPETGGYSYTGQPFSMQAKKFLQDSIEGKKVALKSYGLGGYNRQLAEVFINNKNINLEILKKGLAEVYRGKTAKGIKKSLYLKAQARARKNRRGIWSLDPGEYKSPGKWRKEHPRK